VAPPNWCRRILPETVEPAPSLRLRVAQTPALQGTKIFVQGVIEGKTTEQIMPLLNVPSVGGGIQGEIIYEFKRF